MSVYRIAEPGVDRHSPTVVLAYARTHTHTRIDQHCPIYPNRTSRDSLSRDPPESHPIRVVPKHCEHPKGVYSSSCQQGARPRGQTPGLIARLTTTALDPGDWTGSERFRRKRD